MMMNFYIVLLFLLSYNCTFSAQNGKNKADSLLFLAQEANKKSKYTESISYSRNALDYYKKISYDEGIIKSNYMIAYGLCNMANYDESFSYLENIETEYKSYINRNPDFKFNVLDLTGRNYLALGFKKQAIVEFKKQLALSEKIRNPEKKQLKKIRSYIQLSASHENDGTDSTYYYLNKIKTLIKINPKIKSSSRFFLYYNLSDYHLKNTAIIDSAKYYNNQLFKLDPNIQSQYSYDALYQKALILNKQKDYHQSLTYSFSSLSIIKKYRRIQSEMDVYKLIAQNYHNLGIQDKELLYLSKNLKIKDSLEAIKASGILISAERISKKALQKEVEVKKRYKNIVTVIILTIAVIGIGSALLVRKKLHKKRINIQEKENVIEKLTDEKFNEAHDELILLSKKNAPELSIKFIELYPELYQNLLKIHPNIKTSELIFLTYLKLNFKTKEIATYLSVTPRAIEIRKNRLRKKFNIPSEQDLHVWINNL